MEERVDVLQNLEFGIIQVYRADRSLLDMDVKDAIDLLVRHYHAEEEQERPPAQRLGGLAQQVFDSVKGMCEWRLGRSPLTEDVPIEESTIPVAELVECLRKIRKSVQRWSSVHGRQGYLNFIEQYLP